jgi:HEAT repeat protein
VKRLVQICGALIVLAILGGWAFVSWRPSGVIDGQPASEVAAQLMSSPAMHAAEARVRKAGPSAVPDLAQVLHTPTHYLPQPVRKLLHKLPGPWKSTLLKWSRMEEQTRQRMGAAIGLELLGTNAAAAAPILGKALQDFDRGVVTRAASALGRIGPEGVPQLERGLRHSDPFIRGMAAYGLGISGPLATSAVPGLIQALGDEVATVRSSARFGLGKVGVAGLPGLTQALTSTNEQIRVGVIEAIGQIGPPARDALPALLTLAADGEARVRQSVLRAGASIRPSSPELVQAALTARNDPAPEVRIAALPILQHNSHRSEQGLASLVEAARDSSGEVRQAAIRAVVQTGLLDEGFKARAFATLEHALNDPDARVHQEARLSLQYLRERWEKPGAANHQTEGAQKSQND